MTKRGPTVGDAAVMRWIAEIMTGLDDAQRRAESAIEGTAHAGSLFLGRMPIYYDNPGELVGWLYFEDDDIAFEMSTADERSAAAMRARA